MFDFVVVLLVVGWGRPFGNSLVKGVDLPVKGIVPAPTQIVFDFRDILSGTWYVTLKPTYALRFRVKSYR